ncbi:hypothetical protein EB796_015239 [Bugula neritina]|uniref:Uncharacterized protein n=1 Tax=Bugula neritina TaxID=10212 RepID=A0A7J7JM35_BUGNE|nr:hypothetical protein EB796_015239 [Bugula neritina]
MFESQDSTGIPQRKRVTTGHGYGSPIYITAAVVRDSDRNLVPDVRITQIRQEFRNARKLLQWKNDFWCSVTVLERDRDTAMVRRFISQQL